MNKKYITIPKESRQEKSQDSDQKKIKGFLNYVPTDSVIGLNELIYARAKLDGDKIGIHQEMRTGT